VVARQHAVLYLAIDGVRVGGIDAALEAVAPLQHEPVRVGDAAGAARARGAAEAEVVLRAAVDVVERPPGLIDADVVELRDRQVSGEGTVGPDVVAFGARV